MSKTTLTAQALFDYASKFARNAEATGRGTEYPTFREAAKKFRVRLSDIEETCNDSVEDGYLGAIVGRGGSGGYFTYDRIGDYQVEAYK